MTTTTLKRYWDEGRIIRGQWSGTDAEGRELLCLYTALAGDAAARPDTCPAELAAPWIAHLLPWIDDAPSESAWRGIVERVIAIADRLHEVSPECEWVVKGRIVREAMRHTDDKAVLGACKRVASLCERRGRGEHVSDDKMATAAAAARAAAWAEAASWAEAAWAPASATAEASWAAAAREAWAATAAAKAAAAAEAWEATVATAAWAARAEAPDRLADAILTELERDLAGSEGDMTEIQRRRHTREGDVLYREDLPGGAIATIRACAPLPIPSSGATDNPDPVAGVQLTVELPGGVYDATEISQELVSEEEVLGVELSEYSCPRRKQGFRAELLCDALRAAQDELGRVRAALARVVGAREAMVAAATTRREQSYATVTVPDDDEEEATSN